MIDDIIKLGENTPALDPIILENVPYKDLSENVDQVIQVIKGRLTNSGIDDYEMVLISSPKVALMLKQEIKVIEEDCCPSGTVFILTMKINGRLTIKPLDRITWGEYFTEILLGKQPKITMNPMWAQGRIRYK